MPRARIQARPWRGAARAAASSRTLPGPFSDPSRAGAEPALKDYLSKRKRMPFFANARTVRTPDAQPTDQGPCPPSQHCSASASVLLPSRSLVRRQTERETLPAQIHNLKPRPPCARRCATRSTSRAWAPPSASSRRRCLPRPTGWYRRTSDDRRGCERRLFSSCPCEQVSEDELMTIMPDDFPAPEDGLTGIES